MRIGCHIVVPCDVSEVLVGGHVLYRCFKVAHALCRGLQGVGVWRGLPPQVVDNHVCGGDMVF
jgi:hypothetical protein